MLILPAIDIYDGKCVRLRQGDYEQKTVYSESPSTVAQQFCDAGFRFLHIVDLQGAKEKRIVNWHSLETLARIPHLMLEVGGGIRTEDDIEKLFRIGVKRIILGSVAVQQPQLVGKWLQQYGSERIVIGIDIKDNSVAIHGWQEKSNLHTETLLQHMKALGARIVICTDIACDGMLKGPNISLYKKLAEENPDVALIASGGVSSTEDIKNLAATGVKGVIVGKALYEGKISLPELAELQKNL